MFKFFLGLFWGVSLLCNASQREEKEFSISEDWTAGGHLIYDCQKHNGACVSAENFAFCQKLRNEDQKWKKAFLKCAPIRQFSDQAECAKELQAQVDRLWKEDQLCYNPDRK